MTEERLAGFIDWDTASPSERAGDLPLSALTGVQLLTAELAESAGRVLARAGPRKTYPQPWGNLSRQPRPAYVRSIQSRHPAALRQ